MFLDVYRLYDFVFTYWIKIAIFFYLFNFVVSYILTFLLPAPSPGGILSNFFNLIDKRHTRTLLSL